MKLIEINVTEDQLQRASELYPFGAIKDSIMKGKSNIYGAIGEIIVHDYLIDTGRSVDFNSTKDYDMIVGGRKIDVKTKRTTAVPEGMYNCSIAAYSKKQGCDIYLFVRVHENKKKAWILGWEYKKDFFSKAKFNRKGEPDPTYAGWSFRSDCYNLSISQLHEFK